MKKYIFLIFGLAVGIFWSQAYEYAGQLLNVSWLGDARVSANNVNRIVQKPIAKIAVPKVERHHKSKKVVVKEEEPNRASLSAKYPRVIMYGTSWCPYCKKARQFFEANGINFVEYDIEKNDLAKRMYDLLGGHGVPLILVDDNKIFGFDVQRFKSLYAK